MLDNVIAIVIIATVIGLAIAYIIKAKRSGKKCIGCPYADQCGQKHGCNCNTNQKE